MAVNGYLIWDEVSLEAALFDAPAGTPNPFSG
jgi:hypothetical protein